MDLSKSHEFFQPEKIHGKIHIIGCGSVGSTIAENLARCGVKNFDLWDFDTVEPHNIANQMFRQQDVGRSKVEALRDILIEINPDATPTIELHPKGWDGEIMTGYIFLAVDNIELRRAIVEAHMGSNFVKAMFDCRTVLEGAQHYAANWADFNMKRDFLKTMQFSHDEAKEEAPVSACGVTLGVATTVRLVSAYAVNNFINFVKGNGIKRFVNLDGFGYILDAF